MNAELPRFKKKEDNSESAFNLNNGLTPLMLIKEALWQST